MIIINQFGRAGRSIRRNAIKWITGPIAGSPCPGLAKLSVFFALGLGTPSWAENTAWENGYWWSGLTYTAKTFYTVGKQIQSKRPSVIDKTVDLHGAYILPPLAEGHNHWLEPDKVQQYNACYLAHGVLYVRDMANLPYIANQIRLQVNKPDSVDWVSAMEGFTGPDAHPVEVFKAFLAAGVLPSEWKPDFDRQAEFVVRTDEDVDSRFAMLLEQHPSLVKVFLSHSEDYDRNLHGPPEQAQMRGMDPRLLPHLVKLAHSAGLKVAVHAYTVSDFRTVVASGADEDICRAPGIGHMMAFLNIKSQSPMRVPLRAPASWWIPP